MLRNSSVDVHGLPGRRLPLPSAAEGDIGLAGGECTVAKIDMDALQSLTDDMLLVVMTSG
jgi:hypothetical protein